MFTHTSVWSFWLGNISRRIFLINRLMDDVRFSFDQGTTIYMRRYSAAALQGTDASSAGPEVDINDQGAEKKE